MPFIEMSLPYLLQLCLILHVMKTGRDRTWIWVLIVLPIAGGLAYLVMEILPEYMGNRNVRALKKTVIQGVDPTGAYRRAKRQYEDQPNQHHLQLLAQAALECGRTAEARHLFQQGLTGLDADDPVLRFGLAQSCGALGDFPAARAAAEALRRDSPDFRRWQVSWLLGASADKLGDPVTAEQHLREAATLATEDAPRLDFAQLLSRLGRSAEAREIYHDIIQRNRRAPAAVRAINRAAVAAAKAALDDKAA